MSKGQTFFSYRDFVRANTNASSFDYVHALVSQVGMEPEDLVSICKVLLPKFIELEGFVFLEELFVEERFKQLKEKGSSDREIQYWMNLLDLTGVFEGWPLESLGGVAEVIMEGWESQLRTKFSPRAFEVVRILDPIEGEAAITFYCLEPVNHSL